MHAAHNFTSLALTAAYLKIFIHCIVVAAVAIKLQLIQKAYTNWSFLHHFENLAIGEKVFEHSGKVTGFKITKVHPIDGIVTETSFVTDVKGFGKFPNAKNTGSSITTQYPLNGIFDASLQGTAITTTEERDQIFW